MYHPTTRLLTLLEILQSRSCVKGTELASRLDVDPRSLRRYILMLQEMGIPIEGKRGSAGGYRLRPGYKLPPLMFTEEEALAVTLGLVGIQWLRIAISAFAVEGALAKVSRVLPAQIRNRAQTLSAHLVFDHHFSAEVPDLSLLVTLSEAIQESKSIVMEYHSRTHEVTQRKVNPYGLAGWAGHWYLAGYCHLRQGPRTFRLDRIRGAQALSTTFVRPKDFDCLAFILESIATMPGKWPITIEFRCPIGEVQKRIPATYGQLEETEAGVLYRCYFDSLQEAAHYLVTLGLPFVVRAPQELREALQQFAFSLLQTATTIPAETKPTS